HRRDAGIERLFDLLRADKMNVAVDSAGGDDLAFAGNRLGARPDDDVDACLRIRIAGLADRGDAAIAQPEVGLVNTGMVDDQGVGDDAIDGAVGAAGLALPHAVADHLATTKLHLLTVAR